MNSRNFKTMFLLATLTLLLGTIANAQDINLKAKVPFDFQVGEQSFTVGEYQLVRINNIGYKAFRIRGENAGMLKVVSPAYATRTQEQSLLVFHKYEATGGEVSYFLTKIWVAGDTTGYDAGKSRAEQAAARRAARRDTITLVIERTSHAGQ